jgi:putative oxidoreductase
MNRITHAIAQAYNRFANISSGMASPFLLLVRLYWGWQLMQTGLGKLNHLAQATQFFASLGIPAPAATALFVGCVELFGGLLLIVGLVSRLTGVVLTINMLVAFFTADREALFSIFSDPGKFYGAAPYTFLFASLLVLIFGPGAVSLDRWLARRFEARSDSSEAGAIRRAA